MKWPEYDGAFVFGSGIPSGVFRFVGHIVLGIYMSLASGTYKYVKAHAAVVQQPPFNPDTLYLSYLASKWSKIGFWWNFAIWLPTIAAPSLCVTIIGMFDTTITVYFALATVRQGTYIPHSAGPCKNADTWQVPTANGNGSYFHILQTLNTYPDKPEMHVPSDKICQDFVSQWRFGIGSLMAISIRVVRSDMRPERRRKEPYIFTALRVLSLIPYFICEIVATVPRYSIHFLPRPVQSQLRFRLRCINKMSQLVYMPVREVRHQFPQSFTTSKRHQPPEPKEVQCKSKNQRKPLARFLHIDILTLVAQHLHYQDLVNLSLTSKEMRQTVFPDGHLGSERGILRSCGESRPFTRPQLDTLHEETCQPYCSSCYYNKISIRLNDTDRCCNRNFPLTGSVHGSRGSFDTSPFGNSCLLCSICKTLPDSQCLAQLREREKTRMRRKLRHRKHRDDFACRHCSKALPSWGPRWWVCEACGRECTDTLHPPWGFRAHQQCAVAV
ncbi:conserved hypothetical protein [Histoplasma capsulatum var. duboisii H88]|uniref:F-box domain-containing protein n=1 Tax=Ajellomyces capsulatus (strain H88) TaxID=544711 RepID=F0UL52_AJEC8|nr:conserved hypothetical protein [Histoplasma capsulatum var. duboisii H88]